MDEYANLEAEVLQEMEEEEARNNELRKIQNRAKAKVSGCLTCSAEHFFQIYIMNLENKCDVFFSIHVYFS